VIEMYAKAGAILGSIFDIDVLRSDHNSILDRILTHKFINNRVEIANKLKSARNDIGNDWVCLKRYGVEGSREFTKTDSENIKDITEKLSKLLNTENDRFFIAKSKAQKDLIQLAESKDENFEKEKR
jgi:hypothetical protein